MDWSNVFKYDESSPSCLIWNCNIPYVNRGIVTTTYKRMVGDNAGSLQKSNNRYKVKYQQKAYMVHRIIYSLFFGEIDASLVIDHIDGDSSNNKIKNLRVVTHSVNARNTGKRSNNKTGVNGVTKMEVMDKHYGNTYTYYCSLYTMMAKNYHKYFSVNKLGDAEAFRLACEHRKKMIDNLNTQGANYTERHGT